MPIEDNFPGQEIPGKPALGVWPWFIVYCVLMALIYIVCIGLGVIYLVFHKELEIKEMEAIILGILFIGMCIKLFVHRVILIESLSL